MQPDHGATGANDDIKHQFTAVFGEGRGGKRLHVIRAPGRVNLIGEHTDYNDGFVFPMAIEPDVRLVCRARDDARVRLASTAGEYAGKVVEFTVDGPIEPPPGKEHVRWSDYPRGVVAELIDAGIPVDGMDVLYTNSLPPGSGLSSSAAMEVSTAVACLTLAGLEMETGRLARICQRAEHEFAHVPCGIMDQTIVAGGRAGHAMLLDCRDLSKQFIPLDERDLRVVIVNSMVKHELTGGEYAERRRQCEAGVAHFRRKNPSVTALRDVSMPQVEAARGELDPVVYKRCRHVIGENARTTETASMLHQGHYEQAGELMGKSHASLRDDYEVSCPELDYLADEAVKVPHVYGARMTGGGFGGCVVALAQPRAVEALKAHLTKGYQQQFGKAPQFFVTTATAGAVMLE